MKKPILTTMLKSIRIALKRYSPEILTGVGIAGMVVTTVMAVKVTPKAIVLLEEKEAEEQKPLTPVETVKTAWKCYVPATITGALSIACLVGASSENRRRRAALANACTLTATALSEYQSKVVETVGEKKEQAVRDAIAKDKLETHPVTGSTEVFVTENGSTLCYEPLSGRYFKSDAGKIKSAVNDLNERLLDEGYISLNDFYYEIGLPNTDLGESLGWEIDRGKIKIHYASHLARNNTPCLVIDHVNPPSYNSARY